jgi:diguanylate cyclase
MSDVETTLRGPEAYKIAKRALELMERHQVWPTALNFELWTHYVADPEGALARELTRLISLGEPMTELVSEELAATYLPKARLNEQIRDAGDLLSKELESVSKAIQNAQKSNAAFGKQLDGVTKDLSGDADVSAIKTVVSNLAQATRRVHKENQSLEARLAESTAEVDRLREHLEQVRRDATTDGLTNLANRKAFDEELDRACSEGDEAGSSLCLAVLDIDHFKGFNDTWGHQTGDQVIRYVASVIGRVAAMPRFAARYGGEEFAMIFPRESAAIVASPGRDPRRGLLAHAQASLHQRRSGRDHHLVGLRRAPQGESGHSLMERADAALYASKRGGRNKVSSAEGKPASANAA